MQMQINPSLIDQNTAIMVKISGDGARFSKSSNLILMSFSLPELQKNILSGAGIIHAHIYSRYMYSPTIKHKNNHKKISEIPY